MFHTIYTSIYAIYDMILLVHTANMNFLGLADAISRGPARHRAMQCGRGVGRHS